MSLLQLPPYWERAKAELSAGDPVLAKIIESVPYEGLTTRGDAFFTLARSIAGQQISVKAADSIWKRIVEGLPRIHPKAFLEVSDEALRSFGLSGQKVKYLRGTAQWFAENPNRASDWQGLEEETVINELVALPGIGRWTAEMFLIFHLMKPDVFPIGDIGVLKAVYKHYNAGEKMSKDAVLEVAEKWRPWRTVATWYLWRSLDPVPVEY